MWRHAPRARAWLEFSSRVRKRQVRLLTASPHTLLCLQSLIHGFVAPPYQTRPWTQAAKALWGRRGAADILVDVLEELTPPSPRCCWLVLKNAPLRMPQNGHWMATAHIFPKGERWALLLHNSVPVDLHFELFWIFSCIYSDVKEKLNFFSKSCSDNLKWHLTDSAIYCAIHAQKTRNAESPFPQILHS